MLPNGRIRRARRGRPRDAAAAHTDTADLGGGAGRVRRPPVAAAAGAEALIAGGNQSTAPEQNFGNPAFDGRRGRLAQNGHPDARRYGEYLDPAHRRHLIEIGVRMRDAAESVNGRRHIVQQGAQLYGTSGPSLSTLGGSPILT